MKRTQIVTFGIVILATTAAMAQRGPYYGGYIDNKAATPAESYARGMSDVMVGAGQSALLGSEAAINMQEAESKQLDNKLKGQQTYYEMRRQNKYYQESKRPSKLTQARLTQLAHEKAPKRLGPTQIDPVTGAIAWPIVLTDEPYAKQREELEALYAQRANSSGAIGLKSYQSIRDTCSTLKADLKRHIRDYDPGAYLDARKFVDSLAYEGRHPTG